MTGPERERLHSLLVRLADGDRSAFEPFYRGLWPLLRSFALRLLADPLEAEDAAQEALLKVFRRASQFDRQRDAVTWALGLTAWECRTLRQKRRRRREQDLPEGAAVPSSPAADVQAELIERDLLAAAEQCLGRLAAGDREALLAMLERGPRPAISGAAFRKRLERALVRLRQTWRTRYGAG